VRFARSVRSIQRQRANTRSLRTQQRVLRPHRHHHRISMPRRAVLTAPAPGTTELVSVPPNEHQQGTDVPDMALDAPPEGKRASCSLERR
jgi:hypothetical protein